MKLTNVLPFLGAAQAFSCNVATISAALPDNATVTYAFHVPSNGTINSTVTGKTALPLSQAVCVVQANILTPGNTSYNFGLLLPDSWNGRFLAAGNSGYNGDINWNSLTDGLGYGFAVVATDTGHQGTAADATWAYNNPESVINWAWRALHGTVINGKAIVETYYNGSISYSYYRGCSTGGKQGFKEIEMFPEDFDGVVAGAPAWNTKNLFLWNGIVGYWNWPETADYHIDPSLYAVMFDEILKQCDPQDGVADNIIMDPLGCNYNLETLLCPANVTNSTEAGCLTSAQMVTADKWYNDWRTTNDTLVFQHFLPGSEWQWNQKIGLLSGPEPSSHGTEYIQYMLGYGPNWTWNEWSDDLIAVSDRINPGNSTADNFDISPFYKKGGKLIHYHGLGDGSIAPGSSIYLRDKIDQALTPQGIEIDDFYKFYLIPGMGHCSNTSSESLAPWYIAGDSQAVELGNDVYSVPGFSDPKHDVLLAMMAWVENGTVPTDIVATTFGNTTSEVIRQRPLCVYPRQAFYNGSGNVNTTENWHCQTLY